MSTGNSYVLPLILFLLVNNLSNATVCRKGYIFRDGLCCKEVICARDLYVVPCTSNYGNDVCEKCPNGTHLPDVTNSTFFDTCFPHNCPEDTIPTKIKSHDGCSLYCKCNVEKGYCGLDPCSCSKPTVQCGYRMERAQNCGCDRTNITITSTNSNLNMKVSLSTTPSDRDIQVENQNREEGNRNSISPNTTNQTIYVHTASTVIPASGDSLEKTKTTGNGVAVWIQVLIGTLVAILAILAVFVIRYICKYRKTNKKKKQYPTDYHRTNGINYYDNRTTYVQNRTDTNVHNHHNNTINNVNDCTTAIVGDNAKCITNNSDSKSFTEQDVVSDHDQNSNPNEVENGDFGSFRGFTAHDETKVKEHC